MTRAWCEHEKKEGAYIGELGVGWDDATGEECDGGHAGVRVAGNDGLHIQVGIAAVVDEAAHIAAVHGIDCPGGVGVLPAQPGPFQHCVQEFQTTGSQC